MSIRTNYEKWYEGDTYYWGLEPGDFLEELIELCPPSADKKVLDIGCGEGKDAVYMAQKSYDVTAFDLTENGIRKTVSLAEKRNVNIRAYVDDINTFSTDEQFDIIYSTGTVQYLFEENKKGFFEKLDKITKKNGIPHYHCRISERIIVKHIYTFTYVDIYVNILLFRGGDSIWDTEKMHVRSKHWQMRTGWQ